MASLIYHKHEKNSFSDLQEEEHLCHAPKLMMCGRARDAGSTLAKLEASSSLFRY